MKKWKKFLSLACATVMSLSLSVTAFAAETPNAQLDYAVEAAEEQALPQSQNVFSMDGIPVTEDGVMPYLTITGNGGTCTLDYMSSGKYVAWSVNPATILTYTFVGEISIYTYSTGAYKGSGACAGFGIGSESGIVDVTGMGLRSGTKYKAVFTGVATDIAGNVFTVSSSASLPFTYYK